MGFVTIGIFTLTEQGVAGAMFQMISHGLVSAALFFCVGVVYDRLHTREISAYGGVAAVMPRYAVFFMFMMLASVGLPGTSGFVGEMLVLVGACAIVAVLLGVGAAVGLGLRRRGGGGGGGGASREPTAGGAAPTPKVTGDAGSTSGKSGKTKSGSSKTKSSSKSGSSKPRKKERRKYNGLVESEEEEEEEDVEANGGVEMQPAPEKREMELNDMDL